MTVFPVSPILSCAIASRSDLYTHRFVLELYSNEPVIVILPSPRFVIELDASPANTPSRILSLIKPITYTPCSSTWLPSHDLANMFIWLKLARHEMH